MDGHGHGGVGSLLAIAVATLLVFYFVWAAMHDIAHGESDSTFEYTILVISIPAFAFLYRLAFRLLMPKAKAVWLGCTGLLILLFDAAAVNVKLRPEAKYAADPMLATLFLIAGLPVLALLGYHFFREVFALRTRTGS